MGGFAASSHEHGTPRKCACVRYEVQVGAAANTCVRVAALPTVFLECWSGISEALTDRLAVL